MKKKNNYDVEIKAMSKEEKDDFEKYVAEEVLKFLLELVTLEDIQRVVKKDYEE